MTEKTSDGGNAIQDVLRNRFKAMVVCSGGLAVAGFLVAVLSGNDKAEKPYEEEKSVALREEALTQFFKMHDTQSEEFQSLMRSVVDDNIGCKDEGILQKVYALQSRYETALFSMHCETVKHEISKLSPGPG